MVYQKPGTKFAFSRADVWNEYLCNCFKWLNVTWLSLLSIFCTLVGNSSILSGGFQGQPMESGFLTSLLVAFSCLLITLAGLLVTDANWNRCPVLYLHHPRIVKCYAIFCGYEYLLRLEWHFIDCLDHELRKRTVKLSEDHARGKIKLEVNVCGVLCKPTCCVCLLTFSPALHASPTGKYSSPHLFQIRDQLFKAALSHSHLQ